MIFVTVGTQLPFPRLIQAMDGLAAAHGLEVVAQTGPAPAPSDVGHLTAMEHLAPDRFEALFAAADRVVAHAGIGTVLTAKRLQRPLILLPRRHALGEHRNDHQLATAKALEGMPGLHIAWDTAALERFVLAKTLTAPTDRPGAERASLIDRVRAFIATGR